MFVIFYGDGTTYEGSPELAPKTNVQAIVQSDGGRHFVTQRGDFYLWRDDWGGIWQEADQFGMMLYMIMPGYKIVLFGETIPNGVYELITQEAISLARERNK
jgi:hypothetical protein